MSYQINSCIHTFGLHEVCCGQCGNRQHSTTPPPLPPVFVCFFQFILGWLVLKVKEILIAPRNSFFLFVDKVRAREHWTVFISRQVLFLGVSFEPSQDSAVSRNIYQCFTLASITFLLSPPVSSPSDGFFVFFSLEFSQLFRDTD